MLSTKGNGAGAYSQNIFCSNFSSLGYKCFKFFGYESVTKTSEIGYRTWKFQSSVHVDGYFTVRRNMIDKQRRKTPKKKLFRPIRLAVFAKPQRYRRLFAVYCVRGFHCFTTGSLIDFIVQTIVTYISLVYT